jgi:ABC-type multidrug transport system fused ATPase/permease subunit
VRNIFQLIKLIPGYKGRFIRVMLIDALLGIGATITPYIFKVIVDNIVSLAHVHANPQAIQTTVVGCIVLLAGIRLATVAGNFLQDRVSDTLYLEIMWGLRRQLFKHLMKLSVEYYEQHRAGEIVQRATNATTELRALVQQWAEGSLISILTIVFVMAVLLVHVPLVGLLLLVMIPAMLAGAILRIRRTQPLQREWLKLAEKTVGTMTETISLIATVRSFAQEKARVKRFEAETDTFTEARMKHFRVEWRLTALQSVIVSITAIGALAIVAVGALRGTYTPGDIILVLTYVQMIIANIQPVVRLIVNTGEAEISAERAVELLHIAPTVTDYPGAIVLEKLESIEFNDVSFHYPGKEHEVLRHVSFTLKSGHTLALVGPSGVGKTTITKLLMRFYDPTDGQILINGQDIRSFTQASIRERIGVVMQEVALFNDTIEENLRFAKPEASDAELKAAAATAHADIFIDKLPEQYTTLVGERGVKLSGGEKQRVAIARAILRDPQLAILDEATSALDSESEQYVQDGLKRLLKNRTAIIIAHRLSTVRQADQIVVLQDGMVIEGGTHTELADQQGGLYAKLFKLQTEGVLKG